MKIHLKKDKALNRYSCEKCDYVTVSVGSYRNHKITNHSPSLICSVCQLQFDSYSQMYRHRLKHNDYEIEKYNCSHCQKVLKSLSSLNNHIKLFHSGETPKLSCPVAGCKKACVTEKQLKIHIKTHDEECKVVCPECGLSLANNYTLEKHIKRVHLKLRKFACDICDYRGFFKFNIVDHVKQRKFFCSFKFY